VPAHLSYLQAVLIGLLQGVTELFPVSSLGHSVLVPALLGGSWQQLVTQQSQAESPYLAFIVGLHVATGSALLLFFWRDWLRLTGALISSVRRRRISTTDERLIWLLIVASIPAGITGLALEHLLRTLFAKPLAASVFLMVNGLILLGGEQLRRRSAAAPAVPVTVAVGGGPSAPSPPHGQRLDIGLASRLSFRDAAIIGTLQAAALFAGISRSGVTMVGGLLRGLDHENAARFAFLLATPIIFAAGVYKLPDLAGPLGAGIRGQVLAGSAVAFVAAYATIRFLTRYFETRTLTPFAVYCLVFGAGCLVRFG